MKKEEKKELEKIGFNIWRILAYLIIYSILGFIVETLFGLFTKGVLESRKAVLYGPFCTIYGIGAIIMSLSLKMFRKNKFTLFIGGFIVGSILEFILSLIGELIFNVIWWDYSNMPFNLDGRVCVDFSMFWGLLAIVLMEGINTKIDIFIDNFIKKFSLKVFKTIIIVVTSFLIIDNLITGFAIKMFFARLVKDNNISVKQEIINYEKLYENKFINKMTYTFLSDRKMLKTFPNLKITDINGEIIYIDTLLPNIQPYYLKLFDSEQNKIKQIIKEGVLHEQ